MPEQDARDVFDLTIIGSGPTGLFAAYYAGFRGLRTQIIDSMPELGGQITALYPDKYIYDVAGFPKILGKELVKNLVAQAMQYEPTICLNEQVLKLEHQEDKTILLTTDKETYLTRAVLITVGIGVFTPRRFNDPAIEAYGGKGLHYFVKDVEAFRGKRLLIVGGGDSAVDWALNLERLAQRITLIHRRDKFRAHEGSVQQLMSSTVDAKLWYELKGILGDGKVEGAVIYQNKTKEEEGLELDAIIACLGFLSNLGPLKEWGLELENDAIVVNSRMETNLPGIYAAGDVAAYPGKVKLIATGFGEAATAVNNAVAYIYPGASVFPGHSSTIMEKKEKAEKKG
ncbi:MAG: NAD(P)/FAD-dependent oxidoreductase [candidate division NC10 bacterium]|nr:NAD(P)/FAD-dependent oxidoreductase [candidate division NC10 bacterium]